MNASPLILLGKVGRLELLRTGVAEILVPEPVLEEIAAKGDADATLQAVRSSSWLDIRPVAAIPPEVAARRLDRGETAVLALAHGQSGCEVVLDDLAARRAAVALGLRCVGTLGLVLLARREALIPAVRPVVEELCRSGLYLDFDFIAEVLRRVGE